MDDNTMFQIMSGVTSIAVGLAIYFYKKMASSDYAYRKILEDYLYLSGEHSNLKYIFHEMEKEMGKLRIRLEEKGGE